MEEAKPEDTVSEIEGLRMPLGAHLEELRRRVVYSLISIVLCFILCWFFKVQILDMAKRPHKFAMEKVGLSTELQVLSYQEGFYAYMKLCFITSVFLAYPFVIYQIWQFVSAGLYKKEQRYVLLFLPVSYAAFVVGGLFGYFLLIPFGLQFLIGILGPGIQPIITMKDYVSFVFMLTVALGLVFQLPLVMLLLSKIRFITPDKFIAWRKYAILVIFIIAAIVTPPDPFTQSMTAIPMIVLYELGILIARPTKKGFFLLGTIVGGGILLLLMFYFYFTHKGGEVNLLDTRGEVQFLHPEGQEWEKVANHTRFRNGVTLKTGSEGSIALSTRKGIDIGMDANTEVHIVDSLKLRMKSGQILISVKGLKTPLEIDTPNGRIRTERGTLNIVAKDFITIVTAVKGDAVLVTEGEEKKLLEGRQHKMSIGGEPVDIGAIINWSEGVINKSAGGE
ncbi:MAG: twin-arginine translocase subunit TatC [Candidatus Brocadia sp.]|nr:twin-arginine translocase subunit TatC [Candidatus Brocadia sp.]MDG6025182.1 twin-arginine translocase subunit TatC [Candidatus Brocadia sp.]